MRHSPGARPLTAGAGNPGNNRRPRPAIAPGFGFAQDLALTDAQKPQFQQILAEERTNLGASMQQEREQKTDVQIAHQNHQKIEDAAMAKLKPLLSTEQYQKYQGIVEAEAYARHHRAPAAASAPAAP